MNDLRKVLYVVGSRDVEGVGRASLCSVETLARTGWLRPLVCGPEGELVDFATAAGLPVTPLAPTPASRHRGGLLERAIDNADLVHALGLEAARLVGSVGGPKDAPLVVTVDALRTEHAMRRWRSSPISARRANGALRWLVPGHTATSRLVHSRLVRGDQVVTLPLLPFAPELHDDWSAVRATARERLGIAPGVRVVLGVGPARMAPFRRSRAKITSRAGKAEVIWIDTGYSTHTRAGCGSGVMVVTPTEGRQLLPAMDVLLASGAQLVARHPAVDAHWAGVPIVTTPIDAAAEIVRHSVNGYVCAPAQMLAAVEAALEMAASRTLVHQSTQRRLVDPAAAAVTATARCYSSILGHPLVRPVLIGRQAAR